MPLFCRGGPLLPARLLEVQYQVFASSKSPPKHKKAREIVKAPTALYIHIPFCARKCPYCGFFSEAGSGELLPDYLDALRRELDAAPRNEPMQSIYIGGGTPTLLEPEQIDRLLRDVRGLVAILPDCEFTVEANPGTLTAEKAAALREGGANRISLGAQSFSPATLQTLGRIHGPDDTRRSIEQLHSAGFENIGLDLIYAVPGQTPQSWAQDLDAAVALEPQHISAYGLSFDEGTQFEQARAAGKMQPIPDDDYLQMYALARERLRAAGLEHYEISNFARKGRVSRHNVNYWLNGSYLGIGASATGFVSGVRSTNAADIRDYIRRISLGETASVFSERLEPEAFARETAAFNIRYLPGIERQSFHDRTGFEMENLLGDAIEHHARLGLLEYDGTTLRLTEKALPVADSISAAFLEDVQ